MRCKDFEVCGNEADDRYTMDFTDVKSGTFIHWCAKCGPAMHAIGQTIEERCEADPTFARKLSNAIDAVKEPFQ